MNKDLKKLIIECILLILLMFFCLSPVILYMVFETFQDHQTNSVLVIDNSKVANQRFSCVSYVYENCGLTCTTDENLTYKCLTNYRLVGYK